MGEPHREGDKKSGACGRAANSVPAMMGRYCGIRRGYIPALGGAIREIKDFLVSQDRSADVTLEGQVCLAKEEERRRKSKRKAKEGRKEI